MFNRLLVALDLSKYNEVVFQTALDMAKSTGASMMLVHVPSADDPESPSMPTLIGPDYAPSTGTASVMEIYEKLWQAYEEKGYKMLQEFEEKAIQAGVTVEYTQNPGAPGKMICKLADSERADLVVIGRRGHSGWNEFIAGSVSNYVMHHAPCSVLIVQNPNS
jgi:nucleotide-binding universal stress UspA family protein